MATLMLKSPDVSPSESSPTREQVLDAIRAVLPALAERAVRTETDRQVPRENVEALRAAGLYRLLQPREFGGWEQEFEVLAEVIQELGTVCASTAWVCGLQAAHQWLLAQFPVQAQHDVWRGAGEGLLCGSYAPVARARPVEGGHLISGCWSFASGCDVSDWALCAALIPGASPEAPVQPAFLLVPSADYRIEDDWHTVGLAGTGSKSLRLEDVFVPTHRMLFFGDVINGRSPGSRHHAHNPTYTVPMFSYFPACLASAGLGAAMGALTAYVDEMSGRKARGTVAGGAVRVAEFPTIQIRVTEASASIDAAREILMRDLRRRTASARAGRPITRDERLESRRGHAFAVKLAVQAVELLNASTGGQGLALSNPIQRAWRDVHATARHLTFNWDSVGSMYGQHLFGFEPKGAF